VVSQRQDSYDLLKQLLASGAVKEALASANVQQLVACQVANLQRMSRLPAFSWKMKKQSCQATLRCEDIINPVITNLSTMLLTHVTLHSPLLVTSG